MLQLIFLLRIIITMDHLYGKAVVNDYRKPEVVGFLRQIPGITLAFSQPTLEPIILVSLVGTRQELDLTRIYTTRLTRALAGTCWTRPCLSIDARRPTCRLTKQALARCSSRQLLRVRRQILRIDISFRDLSHQQAVATIEGAVLTEAALRLKVVADPLIKARTKTLIRSEQLALTK